MSPGSGVHASAVNSRANVTLLQTDGLTRHFHVGGLLARKVLHAVDDVSMVIRKREIVALVGESGSGKSTVARLIGRIYRPTRGTIHYAGRPVQRLRSHRDVLWYRGEVGMVLQDPYASLNAFFRVSHGVVRNLKLHQHGVARAARWDEAARIFEVVGLTPAADMLAKFPHEMSGGQRQRVSFAAALASRPRLIVADEPVSMLDVSIRASILNLMADLRDHDGVSFLYITHDLASVRYIADRVLVMYAGRLVESGPVEEVLAGAKHPYTEMLISAAVDPREKLTFSDGVDLGEPPKVINPGEGCRFRSRCTYAIDRCREETPALRWIGPEHEVACHVRASEAVLPGGEKGERGRGSR